MEKTAGWKSLKGWLVDHYFNRGSPTSLCGMVATEEETTGGREHCITCEFRLKHRSGAVGKPRGP